MQAFNTITSLAIPDSHTLPTYPRQRERERERERGEPQQKQRASSATHGHAHAGREMSDQHPRSSPMKEEGSTKVSQFILTLLMLDALYMCVLMGGCVQAFGQVRPFFMPDLQTVYSFHCLIHIFGNYISLNKVVFVWFAYHHFIFLFILLMY